MVFEICCTPWTYIKNSGKIWKKQITAIIYEEHNENLENGG